jgi:hypothetical protein
MAMNANVRLVPQADPSKPSGTFVLAWIAPALLLPAGSTAWTVLEAFSVSHGKSSRAEYNLSFPKIPSGLDSHRKAESPHH